MKIAAYASFTFAALLLGFPYCFWLFLIGAYCDWRRDRASVLSADISESHVEIAESPHEVLAPGDRAYALREYVWIARSQHSGDFAGDTLIDITPPRNRPGNPHRHGIEVRKPDATDATG